ncbi:MAG: sugar transferase [Bdellovibrionota bacterium]|nr:sugar transferase [Bdellovibrionota bacterium]
MKFTFLDSIYSESSHGQYLRKFREFEEETPWADPVFKLYFRTAKTKSTIQRVDYMSEASSRLLALVLLLALSPVFLIIATAIKLCMPGEVFYRQVRVGRDGKLFDVIKFRSMVENAEEQTGHTLSWEGDPRVTKLGNFLRKSHLDELPQLINIVKGDMFFIGPRPERPEFTKIYDETIRGYADRHLVKPGITGLAQIACKYDATATQKLHFDMMYIALKDSIILNLLIAFHTAKKMVLLRSTTNILK